MPTKQFLRLSIGHVITILAQLLIAMGILWAGAFATGEIRADLEVLKIATHEQSQKVDQLEQRVSRVEALQGSRTN